MNSTIKLIVAVLLLSLATNAESQIKVDLKKKVENAVNRRANQRTDQAINKGLDAVENAVKEDIKNAGNEQPADAQQNKNSQSGGQADAGSGKQAGGQQTTSLQAYSKYDFVPGDKIILYEDFSQDAVGDFPALWTTDAAGEINSLNIATGNWLNLNSGEGTYWFMKDIEFPQNFIIELDIVPKPGGLRIAADMVLFGEDSHSEMDKNGNPGTGGLHIQMEKQNWITKGYRKGSNDMLSGSSQVNTVEPEKVNHVIVWVQNRRVRIYNKGAKVLDMPTNIYEGTKFKRLCFKLYRGASSGSYISNIKITTAAPDMRSKLLTEGKLVSYGIYFDVNKDNVKPESYGTLKEVATVMTENPGLRVKIVGHTDADGADASNLDLSKRRGAAVKNELVKTFGIDASRLESDGLGENQPVAPNDTPSNKALNRRVEFIRL
jgi:outer membrane protein OmpA-like peptidoglycan-associated protein